MWSGRSLCFATGPTVKPVAFLWHMVVSVAPGIIVKAAPWSDAVSVPKNRSNHTKKLMLLWSIYICSFLILKVISLFHTFAFLDTHSYKRHQPSLMKPQHSLKTKTSNPRFLPPGKMMSELSFAYLPASPLEKAQIWGSQLGQHYCCCTFC